MTKVGTSQNNGRYTHIYTGSSIFTHPSSVMFRQKEGTVSFIATSETTKPY